MEEVLEHIRALKEHQSLILTFSDQGHYAIKKTDEIDEQRMLADSLRTVNGQLADQLVDAQNKIDSLQAILKEKEHLEHTVNELNFKMERLQGDLQKAESIAANLHNQSMAGKQALEARDNEVRALQQRIDMLKAAGCSVCDGVKADMERLQDEHQQTMLALKEAQEANSLISQFNDRIKSLTDELDKLQSRFNAQKSQLEVMMACNIDTAYIRNVFIKYLQQKPETRQASLELLKAVLRVSPEDYS